MAIEQDAANVAPPRAYSDPKHGVYCRANVAASTRYTIPASWKGNYVTFVSKGDDVWVNFGGSTVAVTATTTVSNLASEDLTPVAGQGYWLQAGVERNFLIPDDDTLTKFALFAGGTTGYWYAYMSVNPRLRP